MPYHYGPLLRMLHSSIDQSITQAVESMDLTASQGHIIGFLAAQETPPTPRDLEEVFHLSHPTVSGLLSRMEKKGFITFRPDEKDRRCKRILLLPKGQECSANLYQSILRSEEQLVAGFTPEEQELFRIYLKRAISNMNGWPNFPNRKEELNK